jgi:holo-[acyl-carrier protein] synthase
MASMRIIGIGLDATEIPRIADTMAQYGDRFLYRVFTDGEIEYCQAHRHAAQHFAARFAVKEAAMKALGTGHSHGVLWRHVEVVRRGGPPQLQLHGAARQRFESMGGTSSVVTITHTDTLALAQVILMGQESLR